VRHEIVHNRHVVEELKELGAVFVEELDEVPDDAVVVFSAHGVPKSVPAEAKRRHLIHADATCPLVSKVHREVERHQAAGRTVLLIGHAGHPEVIGTMGQAPEGSVILVETAEAAARVEVPDPARVAFSTQTTLSVRDTAGIVEALKRRFPLIDGPRNEDICYATTNRQRAVAAIAPTGRPDARGRRPQLLELGAAGRGGATGGLPARGADRQRRERGLDGWFEGVGRVGISAGASAPEILVEGVLAACRERFDVQVEEVKLANEDVYFRTPPIPLRRAS
jgi:4-hydroxy-3-methylbut-2-enyl diphosphate reductase